MHNHRIPKGKHLSSCCALLAGHHEKLSCEQQIFYFFFSPSLMSPYRLCKSLPKPKKYKQKNSTWPLDNICGLSKQFWHFVCQWAAWAMHSRSLFLYLLKSTFHAFQELQLLWISGLDRVLTFLYSITGTFIHFYWLIKQWRNSKLFV